MTRHFTPALFSFLKELADNNSRDWFSANKDRYEAHVKEPALEFVTDFGPRLATISEYFTADSRAQGGSLFRIHRDMRFSKDKTPYKTSAAMHFRHVRAKHVHSPGFYLHLEPRRCSAGVGIWRPDTATASKIRQAIADDPDGWKKAAHGKRFLDTYTHDGESLQRVPKGLDADHPFADDLRRKDFTAFVMLTQRQVTADGFIDEYTELCRAAGPFMRFLCEAIGLRY